MYRAGALVNRELLPYYRDVAEHLLRSVEVADNVRESLTTILEVRTAQAANQLNEVMKKLTAWRESSWCPRSSQGSTG